MTFEQIMARLGRVAHGEMATPSQVEAVTPVRDFTDTNEAPRFCAAFQENPDNHRPALCRDCTDIRNGIEVVWSGRDPLIPARDEAPDNRMAYVPSYDLDEGESAESEVKRKYTYTGNHKRGKVLQFVPRPQMETV